MWFSRLMQAAGNVPSTPRCVAKKTSSSAIAERPHCRVGYGQKWKTGTERNIYGQYKSIFNHCDVFGQQRNRNRRKNAK